MPIEIKITADTPAEAIADMTTLLGQFIAKVEKAEEPDDPPAKKPKTVKRTKKAAPKPKEEVNSRPEEPANQHGQDGHVPDVGDEAGDGDDSLSGFDARDKAITILMNYYAKNKKSGAKETINALLEKYGVKNFTDVPEDAGNDLLADANKVVA